MLDADPEAAADPDIILCILQYLPDVLRKADCIRTHRLFPEEVLPAEAEHAAKHDP